MREWIARAAMMACLLALATIPGACSAAERHPANVPPPMEIEVIDPGVDPEGKPAVMLEPGPGGQMQVDIPPVVLVHRYYYTGDRSFQGPPLPGGPSIVVAHHPQTGERCYIPVQMMPGAPRVTYTAHSIEYDYGRHATTVCFDGAGNPSVKYRTGRPLRKRMGDLVHIDQWYEHAEETRSHLHEFHERSRMVVTGATLEITDAVEMVTLPARNMIEMMPFGQIVFGSDLEGRFARRAAEHEREKAAHHAEKDAKWAEMTIGTVR